MTDQLEHDEAKAERAERKPRRSIASSLRIIVILALIAALVVVALDNTSDVRVGYAIGDAKAPIWIVLVAAAACGVVIGWLIRHRPHRHS